MKKSRTYLLKVRSLDNQWHDRDKLLLHTAFQILTDFVVKEKPFKCIDWSYDKLHRQTAREIKSLYAWWRNQRRGRCGPLDNKRLKVPPFKFEKVKGSKYFELTRPNKKNTQPIIGRKNGTCDWNGNGTTKTSGICIGSSRSEISFGLETKGVVVKRVVITSRVWQLVIAAGLVLLVMSTRYYPFGLHYGLSMWGWIFVTVLGLTFLIFIREF